MNASPNSGAASPLQGARVLVIEDDALLLMELEAILVNAGAEVIGVCRTVPDGVAAAQQEDIAAAVLDVRIGRDTIAPVARQLASRGTPFVFYTGQVGNDPAIAEWADRVIVPKPAKAATIVSAVAGLLPRGGDRDPSRKEQS
jgi:DNA-binding NarL/FixJ family response regulator